MSLIRRFLPISLKPYAGRLIITMLAFIISILFLTIGFFRTLLIIILCTVGYVIGVWVDKELW
ncbi:MAG TPA: DUF2273 domain-containing protein [Candidatus Dorea intestinavium]|nr:DUF2273 domain-containing protein [Candidatus Dorea intestinavium]